jgi:hypothetical protein
VLDDHGRLTREDHQSRAEEVSRRVPPKVVDSVAAGRPVARVASTSPWPQGGPPTGDCGEMPARLVLSTKVGEPSGSRMKLASPSMTLSLRATQDCSYNDLGRHPHPREPA